MNMLFESFILDTIGKLPDDRVAQLNSMDLSKVFKTEPKDWKLIIKQVLNLSDTIEIAILDLWYKNQDIASKQGIDYDAVQFAIDFVDNYYKDDSKIDVWTDDTLAQAKERIRISENRKLE